MRTHPYLVEMGGKIKAARKAKKLTVRQLGALCELDYSCLNRTENGQYSARVLTLKRIADVLEKDIKDFL